MAEYRDSGTLGSGGYGIVVKCVREGDGQVFAKKLLLASDDAEAAKRFQREVRILQRLDHHRIVRIVDVHLDEAPFWYVMPLYRHSLRDLIPELMGDRNRIARIYSAVLEGMEYAHSNGIIHRDLKPENILLNDDDDVVISDFGLGRALDAETSRATTTGDWVGTFGYMAPEQLQQAKHADARSDVYSLGRILYVTYTGDLPSAMQELTKLPLGIAAVVERCTKNNANERCQSVKELRTAFGRLAAHRRKLTADEELTALMDTIVGQRYATAEQANALADLVSQCQEDLELLHGVAMRLPGPAFTALHEVSPEILKVLISQFLQNVISRGWAFAYTDSIADACLRIYSAVADPNMRAQVVAAVIELGASHNRFYVMDMGAGMVAAAQNDGEARALAHALRSVGSFQSTIEGRVKMSKLHPIIRELFDAPEGE